MKSIFHQPVPEMQVANVETSQAYYRDKFGFEIGWLIPEKTLGAVSKDEAVIFLRQSDKVVATTVWIFVDDVDAIYKEFVSAKALVSERIETKSWGIRQFTIQDPDGNMFIFHHDV